MTFYRIAREFGCLAVLSGAILHGQQKRPIEPADCVTVRYLMYGPTSITSPIQINRQGTRVAYLVKVPDIQTNQNDVELFVKDIVPHRGPEKLLLTADPILQMQWLGDGEHVAVLARDGGHAVVEMVDVVNGEHEVLAESAKDITEYSIDATGDTMIYAVEVSDGHQRYSHTPEENASGYRIEFTTSNNVRNLPTRHLFVMHRNRDGRWGTPMPLILHSPFTGRSIREISYYRTMYLRMSPDGHSVLFRYSDFDPGLPKAWRDDYQVRGLKSIGVQETTFLVLYDTRSGRTSLPLATPDPGGPALWSDNSSSFVVTALPPVDSEWEAEDVRNKAIGLGGLGSDHLFWVNIKSGRMGRVMEHANDREAKPIFWEPDGTLGVYSERDATFGQWQLKDGAWICRRSTHLVFPEFFSESMTGNSKLIISGYQGKMTPPEIVSFDPNSGHGAVLVRLNPQFDHLELAHVESLTWKTSTGFPIDGALLMPPNYVQGKRYPLLIETKTGGPRFECDSGENHFPSYIPEPAADAGILYLTRTVPANYDSGAELAHYPKGYPGQVAEAAYQTDIWDSAVDMLAKKGMIDRSKVGIIGFSRAGWYTEFALAHGKTHYAAATVTDNIEYEYASYFLFHRGDVMDEFDNMYGGPPYGKTFQNWLDYSISFNVEKIHTPLLMEKMGYGVRYESDQNPPLGLELHLELFSLLSHMNRPVEMYYYPDENHEPDDPQARLATLQRNLDWYRFWLQGYERPNPGNPAQYKRWEHLRELQDAEDKASENQTPSPTMH